MGKHDDYKVVVNRLDTILQSEHDVGDGHHVKTEASVGVSVYPEDGSNIDELIHFADQSMYEVKRLKKSARTSATWCAGPILLKDYCNSASVKIESIS